MSGRKPDKFVLRRKDKLCLQELLRDGQTPFKVARRAQILLNRTNSQQRVLFLSKQAARDPATIWRVCERYRQNGLEAALYDAPRAGRPRIFSLGRTHRD
jgi:hypothetical protein